MNPFNEMTYIKTVHEFIHNCLDASPRFSTSPISIWRLAPILPFYVPLYKYDSTSLRSDKPHWLQWQELQNLSFRFLTNLRWRDDRLPSSIVVQCDMSSSGRLATVLHGGSLFVWTLKKETLSDSGRLPFVIEDHIVCNWTSSQLLERLGRTQHLSADKQQDSISLKQVLWWSETSLVLVFNNGLIDIFDLEQAKSLLKTPLFFSSLTVIATTFGSCHVTILECQLKKAAVKLRMDGGITYHTVESAGEQRIEKSLRWWAPSAWSHWIIRPIQLITDAFLWHFDTDAWGIAQKRDHTLLLRTFKLWEFEQTTPLALLMNKISTKQYEEAMTVAKDYFLDTDSIYKAKWLDSTVNEVVDQMIFMSNSFS
jgi:hypothetical protein